MIFRVI